MRFSYSAEKTSCLNTMLVFDWQRFMLTHVCIRRHCIAATAKGSSSMVQLHVYHACVRVALSGLPGMDAGAAVALLRCFDAPGFVGALLAAGAEEASGRGGARTRDGVWGLHVLTVMPATNASFMRRMPIPGRNSGPCMCALAGTNWHAVCAPSTPSCTANAQCSVWA